MFPFWPYFQNAPDYWAAFLSFFFLVILKWDFEADLSNYVASSQIMEAFLMSLYSNLFIKFVINW